MTHNKTDEAIVEYSKIDHYHCWKQDRPQCGQKIKHFECCLCREPHPDVNRAHLAGKDNDDILARFQFDHTIEADEVRMGIRVSNFPMPKQFLARLRRMLDEARKQERKKLIAWIEENKECDCDDKCLFATVNAGDLLAHLKEQ